MDLEHFLALFTALGGVREVSLEGWVGFGTFFGFIYSLQSPRGVDLEFFWLYLQP